MAKKNDRKKDALAFSGRPFFDVLFRIFRGVRVLTAADL